MLNTESACHPLRAGILLNLVSDREDGGDMILRNIGEHHPTTWRYICCLGSCEFLTWHHNLCCCLLTTLTQTYFSHGQQLFTSAYVNRWDRIHGWVAKFQNFLRTPAWTGHRLISSPLICTGHCDYHYYNTGMWAAQFRCPLRQLAPMFSEFQTSLPSL